VSFFFFVFDFGRLSLPSLAPSRARSPFPPLLFALKNKNTFRLPNTNTRHTQHNQNKQQDVCARSASFDLTAVQRAAAIADVRRAVGVARERQRKAADGAAAAGGNGNGNGGNGNGGNGLTMAAPAAGGSAETGADPHSQVAFYSDLAQQLTYAEQVLLR
jgi:hypothetical protein